MLKLPLDCEGEESLCPCLFIVGISLIFYYISDQKSVQKLCRLTLNLPLQHCQGPFQLELSDKREPHEKVKTADYKSDLKHYKGIVINPKWVLSPSIFPSVYIIIIAFNKTNMSI